MAASLARRYIFKLLANVTAVPVYLVMEAILPRALGPQIYGNYSFATNFFQQLAGFLDMGTSTCLYNSLSRRQHETGLMAFYLRFALLIGACLLGWGLFMLWPPLGQRLMPETPLIYAPLAAGWAFLTWLSRVLRSTNDALGATIASEIWRAALSVAGMLLLIGLFWCHQLSAMTLFIQQYLLLLAMCSAFWLVSWRHWRSTDAPLSLQLPPGALPVYCREFATYSHPLLVQALLSFFMLTAERWLLQYFDGSIQQGFFALSQKVSMACFLFVSAMTPLLMREFSMAWGQGDVRGMGQILRRFAPGLYALAAYFSCFTVVEGKALVEIIGGEQFLAALLPVQIMALYPLHQGYGQLASAIFHASGKTKILRNLTACECIYGLGLAWLFLAPTQLGGLHLGATGLAIKTVLVQFISVNVCLWLAAKMVCISFWRNFAHQLFVAAAFILLALFAHRASLQLPHWHTWERFLTAGVVYTMATGLAILTVPQLVGLNYSQIKELGRRLRRR